MRSKKLVRVDALNVQIESELLHRVKIKARTQKVTIRSIVERAFLNYAPPIKKDVKND